MAQPVDLDDAQHLGAEVLELTCVVVEAEDGPAHAGLAELVELLGDLLGGADEFRASQPAMDRSWNCVIWVPKDWDRMPSTSMVMIAPGQSPAAWSA